MSKKNCTRTLAAGGLALAFAGLLGAAAPATSAPSYDGLWSVVIVTETGRLRPRLPLSDPHLERLPGQCRR